jgi:hypothetical protein
MGQAGYGSGKCFGKKKRQAPKCLACSSTTQALDAPFILAFISTPNRGSLGLRATI